MLHLTPRSSSEEAHGRWYQRALGIFVAGLLVGVVVWGVSVAWPHPPLGRNLVPDGTRRVRCSDFTSHEQAQRAYELGAKWLDGDGDGVACETLP